MPNGVSKSYLLPIVLTALVAVIGWQTKTLFTLNTTLTVMSVDVKNNTEFVTAAHKRVDCIIQTDADERVRCI